MVPLGGKQGLDIHSAGRYHSCELPLVPLVNLYEGGSMEMARGAVAAIVLLTVTSCTDGPAGPDTSRDVPIPIQASVTNRSYGTVEFVAPTGTSTAALGLRRTTVLLPDIDQVIRRLDSGPDPTRQKARIAAHLREVKALIRSGDQAAMAAYLRSLFTHIQSSTTKSDWSTKSIFSAHGSDVLRVTIDVKAQGPALDSGTSLLANAGCPECIIPPECLEEQVEDCMTLDDPDPYLTTTAGYEDEANFMLAEVGDPPIDIVEIWLDTVASAAAAPCDGELAAFRAAAGGFVFLA